MNARIAQLVEHNLAKVGVASSSLVSRSKKAVKFYLAAFFIYTMYQVYILYSPVKDKYYTGSTSIGAKLRLKRNNDGWTQSTKSGIPWALRYVRSFESKTEALKWERFIKRQKAKY